MELQNQDFSFLGRGSNIEGKFHLKGATKIASTIQGELYMEGAADLSIEQGGSVTGDITCTNLEIHGQFTGNLNALGIVVIFPTAVVSGLLTAKKLIVYPGAILNIEGHTASTEKS